MGSADNSSYRATPVQSRAQRRFQTVGETALSPPRHEALAVFSCLWYSDNDGERGQET